jgi:hypothetical protein
MTFSFIENASDPLAAIQNDRLVIISEILLLYFSTELCLKVLALCSLRFRTLPSYRQRQISIIPPIIVFKLTIIILFISSAISCASHPDFSPESLHNLYHIINHITFGYLFEILYRPSPLCCKVTTFSSRGCHSTLRSMFDLNHNRHGSHSCAPL